jgi:hypothetical protein
VDSPVGIPFDVIEDATEIRVRGSDTTLATPVFRMVRREKFPDHCGTLQVVQK